MRSPLLGGVFRIIIRGLVHSRLGRVLQNVVDQSELESLLRRHELVSLHAGVIVIKLFFFVADDEAK